MHFISGLPRSGSTLLAALLRQNPRFHAAMSSALASLVNANLSVMSTGSDISQLLDDRQRPALSWAIFREYCATTMGRGSFFDTNRGWGGRETPARAAPKLPSSWLGHVAPADI